MPAAIPIAIGASGLLSAGASLLGANAQADAATKAAQMQKDQYNQTRADLLPYNTAGQGATNALTAKLPSLTSPIVMDETTLRNTPGYQFNLSQGLKSVQNGAAARGLGSSGAALKGAAGYATGLADSTYQNQFNNELASRQNTYNQLMGVANLGENAGAQTGNIGAQLAGNAGQATVGAGNAIAGGLNGAGNALTNAAGSYAGYNLSNSLMSRGLYGGGASGVGATY
jgi:homoserine kinase